MPRARKPTPRVVTEVCSICGLDWSLHGDEPTTETCVELLLHEVQQLNRQLAARPIVQPISYPVPVPSPRPWPVPYRPTWPWWSGGGTWSVAQSNTTSHMPRLSSAVPFALNATA